MISRRETRLKRNKVSRAKRKAMGFVDRMPLRMRQVAVQAILHGPLTATAIRESLAGSGRNSEGFTRALTGPIEERIRAIMERQALDPPNVYDDQPTVTNWGITAERMAAYLKRGRE